MKNTGFIAVTAMLIMAIVSPLQADIIADQSRITVGAPQVPYIDKVFWPKPASAYLNY